MAMAMELPATGEVESLTATGLHRVLASAMPMPMDMAMAMELPATGEVESLTATGLHRVLASAMLMLSALVLEDSFVNPAPTLPSASTTTAMVPLLTQLESALLMPTDMVMASL